MFEQLEAALDDLFGEERATFDLSHCLDELGPLVFGEAFVATVAGPETDVLNVPFGVVLRRRCPASDDVADAVQLVLCGIGAKQNESGSEAPLHRLELHERPTTVPSLYGGEYFAFPLGTCNPPNIQRIAVAETSCHGLLEALNRVGVLDDFDGVVLHLAGRNELELSLVAEVPEILARIPADVHGLDVGCTEFLGGVCAFAAEFNTEAAEFTEADDVASKKLLAETTDHVGDDTADGTLGEGRVVVGHVLYELVVGELGVSLCGAISLGAAGLCANVGLLRAWLRAHNANTGVNHFFVKVKG